MNTLFTLPDSPSPRIKWMAENRIVTNKINLPHFEPGDEDEFGNEIHPWIASIEGKTKFATADTEMDAIISLCQIHGLKHCNA